MSFNITGETREERAEKIKLVQDVISTMNECFEDYVKTWKFKKPVKITGLKINVRNLDPDKAGDCPIDCLMDYKYLTDEEIKELTY